MRILFLTAQLPEPPHAGGTLRTNGLMRAAHAAGHDVHVLAFGDPDQLRLNRAVLDEFCSTVDVVAPPHRTVVRRLRDLLLTDKADMQRRFDAPEYTTRLTDLLRQAPFDLVQIESLEMGVYLPVIQREQPDTPIIYDSFNAEFDLQRSIYEAERGNLRRFVGALYSLIQWRRLTRFERAVCHAVTHVIAVSEADAEAFQKLAPGVAVTVVPNGIHTNNYATQDTSLDLGDYALVFTGSMGYRPNVDAALWFAEEILGRIRAQAPDAKFFVVGSNPHTRLNVLRERDDVQITGWVPDVNPFLHAAAIYVVPMRMGSGTRLKVLQAMAAGKAVVSTTMGAQGLHITDNVEARIADTADAFASTVIDLLKHPERRMALGTNAATYVGAHYDWAVIASRLLQVYDDISTTRTT